MGIREQMEKLQNDRDEKRAYEAAKRNTCTVGALLDKLEHLGFTPQQIRDVPLMVLVTEGGSGERFDIVRIHTDPQIRTPNESGDGYVQFSASLHNFGFRKLTDKQKD